MALKPTPSPSAVTGAPPQSQPAPQPPPQQQEDRSAPDKTPEKLPDPVMPEGWTDPMKDLDDLAGDLKKPEPKPEPEPEEDQEPEDKKGKEEPKEEPALPGTDDLPPSTAFTRTKPLREAYDRTKTELASTRKRVAELEEQLKTAGSSAPWESQREGLLARITAAEQRVKQYEDQAAIFDYENSREFKEKYVAPLTQAYDAAYAELSELSVTESNGTERPATKEDFLALVQMPLKDASRVASRWFGEVAPHVLSLRNQVRSLHRATEQARQSHKTNAETFIKEQQAKRAQEQAENAQLWKQANESMPARFPQFFSTRDDDPDFNRLLEKGLREFDLAANPQAELTKPQRFQLTAAMRYRAAAFSPLARENVTLRNKINELEEQLSQLQEADPAKGDDRSGGKSTGNVPGSWQEDFDKEFGTGS